MDEPGNHTALTGPNGYTFVRVDECPGRFGNTWHAMTNDPGWDDNARRVGAVVGDWTFVERQGPFVEAGADEAARWVERVRAVMA